VHHFLVTKTLIHSFIFFCKQNLNKFKFFMLFFRLMIILLRTDTELSLQKHRKV